MPVRTRRPLPLPERRLPLVALVLVLVTASALLGMPTPAAAHNSLVASDPADGAVLAAAPTQVVWTFDQPVPLETLSVTMVAADGVRTELPGSVHGPAGDIEVVTPLPPLTGGEISVRWRLVSDDGHPITGRIAFTVAGAPGVTSAPPTAPVVTEPVAGSDTSTSLTPTSEVPVPGGPVDAAGPDGGSVDAGSSASSAFRWALRYGSYLAILAVVGILLTSAHVWAGAGTHALLRQVLAASLVAIAALAFLQALVLAADISGDGLWSSFGSLGAATTTDAGMALMLRIVLASTTWVVLFRTTIVHSSVYWTATGIPAVAMLGTWAFAGHASSMRWPELGVLTDVAHHAAAAAWLAGLAIVGWIVIPRTTPDVVVPAVRNFSRVAAVSVGVIVVTGLVQSWRLVGSPSGLLDTDHGRYLALKLIALGGMLALANANRRRVRRIVADVGQLPQQSVALQRAVAAELAIGLLIVGITAAMVVSPPGTGDTIDQAVGDTMVGETVVGAPGDDHGTPVYYTL